MEKQVGKKNVHLIGGRGVDFGSILTSFGMTKASLEILHNMYTDGDLATVDGMYAAANITKHVLVDAIEDIEEAMEALKTVESGGKG
jgi:hypothetical protein